MNCTKCGTELHEVGELCQRCGASMKSRRSRSALRGPVLVLGALFTFVASIVGLYAYRLYTTQPIEVTGAGEGARVATEIAEVLRVQGELELALQQEIKGGTGQSGALTRYATGLRGIDASACPMEFSESLSSFATAVDEYGIALRRKSDEGLLQLIGLLFTGGTTTTTTLGLLSEGEVDLKEAREAQQAQARLYAVAESYGVDLTELRR